MDRKVVVAHPGIAAQLTEADNGQFFVSGITGGPQGNAPDSEESGTLLYVRHNRITVPHRHRFSSRGLFAHQCGSQGAITLSGERLEQADRMHVMDMKHIPRGVLHCAVYEDMPDGEEPVMGIFCEWCNTPNYDDDIIACPEEWPTALKSVKNYGLRVSDFSYIPPQYLGVLC